MIEELIINLITFFEENYVSIYASLFTGAVVGFIFFIWAKIDKFYFNRNTRQKLKTTIEKANNVFQHISLLSKDYNTVDDELVIEKISYSLKVNLRKITYLQLIIHIYASEVKLSTSEKNSIKEVDELIDWFIVEYGFDITPTFEQKIKWKNRREELYTHTKKIEQIIDDISNKDRHQFFKIPFR